MKKKLYLFSTLLTLGISTAFGDAMPDASLMASGKWTKIRVNADAVYQLTYDELAELGYDNPAEVKVYGYSPTLLLSHSSETIPGDLSPIYTLNVPAQKKILFYLTDNYNAAPEIWRTQTSVNYVNDHLRHSHSEGATYFLSDVAAPAATITKRTAPKLSSTSTWTSSHWAVYYHENDEELIGHGGSWYIEKPSITTSTGVTHEFTVSHLASGNASIFYASMLAPVNTNSSNYMATSFSAGITAATSTGHTPQILGDKYDYNSSMRVQNLTLPLTVEPKTHKVTFTINEGGLQKKPCALDFFAIIYERSNNVGVRPQTMMYYKTWSASEKRMFELTDINLTDWKVWNVSNPLKIVDVQLTQEGNKFYGAMSATTKEKPNEVVAFNTAAEQPTPEIIGAVNNQNLHGISVPDMLIITSTPLLGSAENAAGFHRRMQGLDVAVVDQLDIFNEYGSGNISPEAVRRFVEHLSLREPGKLKGVLMYGPGTTDNRSKINKDSHYVITAQCEDYTLSNNITSSYCADVFFVTSGNPIVEAPWNNRHPSVQVFANPITIGVGRLPFESQSKFDDYYQKVETYLTQLPTYPAMGNAIFVSDFSYVSETRTHLGDSEEVIQALSADKVGKTLTVTRCASNLLSKDNNTILKRILNQACANGAQLYTYFGHGTASIIGGTTSTKDYIFDVQSAAACNFPGKAPFMFIGSCDVAAFDHYSQTLAGALVSNPNGGAMTLISSGREVYPERNVALGCAYAKAFYNAPNNTPIGQVWTSAVSQFMIDYNTSKLNIANTLDYNMIGDPMLPVYRETHNVVINDIEGNALSTASANTITGSVTNLDGTPASDFNGTVILTFYDPVRTMTNVVNVASQVDPPYLRSVNTDQEIIGQVVADVKNGTFEVTAKAPLPSANGTHRIQAYAYSTDATERGLGYIDGITFNSAAGEDLPEAAPVSISDFTANIVTGNTEHKFKVTLTATINAPAGLANANSIVAPVRLWLDDVAKTDAAYLVRPDGQGNYALEYITGKLDFGRHTATLYALDAAGNWAEQSVEFMIDNTPSASISAAVDGNTVNFELSSEVGAATHRLVVENLIGDVIIDEAFTGSTHSVTLEQGIYRAYIQVRSSSAATATEKINFIVE